MSQVCDFASPVNLQSVKNAGYVGIVRYTSDYQWKNITAAEFSQAMALGLTVTLVCEQGNQPALRGTLGGMHDSTIANQQADAVGYEPASTIYYVAEDPYTLPRSSWPVVVDYFKGLAWGGKRPKGAYGSGPLCDYLKSLGLVERTWTVSTWGSPAGDSLVQLVGADTHGLSVDADQVQQADYGQHPRPAAPAPPAPAPPPVVYPGDNVKATPVSVAIQGGKGWIPSPVPAASIVSVTFETENPEVVGRYDSVPTVWNVASQAGPHSPNGAIVIEGMVADGNYGVVIWSAA